MVKTYGYLAMLAGAILACVGLVLDSTSGRFACILIGMLIIGAGYYVAKKQPQLPGSGPSQQ